jgi:hypothetical protein
MFEAENRSPFDSSVEKKSWENTPRAHQILICRHQAKFCELTPGSSTTKGNQQRNVANLRPRKIPTRLRG